MNSRPRSTRVTWIAGSHSRMYLAAVAPPKPAPITTTRALGVPVLAQPAADSAAAAPASLRNSRRLRCVIFDPLFFRGEVVGELHDLLVGIAFRDLVHDRR